MRTALLMALALALAGCNTKERYAANNSAGSAWLQGHSSTPQIDVVGSWHSEVWGGAQLTQNGRSISGTLGDYNVRGKVSGPRACLLLESGGWIHYTAVLTRPNSSTLTGWYSSSVPFHVADQQPLEFRRALP